MQLTVDGKEYALICYEGGVWREVTDRVSATIEEDFLRNDLVVKAEGYVPRGTGWAPRYFERLESWWRPSLPTAPAMEAKSRTSPRRILQHGKATIVWWMDGTKTVVKLHDEDNDPEKALAMALARKVWGRCKTAKYVKRIERGDA